MSRMKLKRFDTFEEFVEFHDGKMLPIHKNEKYHFKMFGQLHKLFEREGELTSGHFSTTRIYEAFLQGKIFK